MNKLNFSLRVELVNAVGLIVIKAIMITENNEMYEAMASHSSSLEYAQKQAIKKVYKLAGRSQAGITDE